MDGFGLLELVRILVVELPGLFGGDGDLGVHLLLDVGPDLEIPGQVDLELLFGDPGLGQGLFKGFGRTEAGLRGLDLGRHLLVEVGDDDVLGRLREDLLGDERLHGHGLKLLLLGGIAGSGHPRLGQHGAQGAVPVAGGDGYVIDLGDDGGGLDRGRRSRGRRLARGGGRRCRGGVSGGRTELAHAEDGGQAG